MEKENNENIIYFIITPNQAEKICNQFDKDYKELEDYEICNYLNLIIDHLQ